ncbi:MAG: hypothetical protein EBR82_63970 [Caulobacteraceae bacterium]|nr:hypothetical protein [Caulobacteraceae bacterium]
MSNPITPIWAFVGAVMLASFYFGDASSTDLGICAAIYALSLAFMFFYSAGKNAEFEEIERWLEGRKEKQK